MLNVEGGIDIGWVDREVEDNKPQILTQSDPEEDDIME